MGACSLTPAAAMPHGCRARAGDVGGRRHAGGGGAAGAGAAHRRRRRPATIPRLALAGGLLARLALVPVTTPALPFSPAGRLVCWQRSVCASVSGQPMCTCAAQPALRALQLSRIALRRQCCASQGLRPCIVSTHGWAAEAPPAPPPHPTPPRRAPCRCCSAGRRYQSARGASCAWPWWSCAATPSWQANGRHVWRADCLACRGA